MDGIVNVLKPAGITSHDVVSRLRKVYKTKKVGHTGTLDPDAVGVLPVCIGQATRLVEYMMDKDKVYRVIMHFGKETDTQDASGQVIKETGLCPLSREEFEALLQTFVGTIEQVPPMYSAIKKDGQPLYKIAREGKSVEVEPRPIEIYGISLQMYQPESAMLEVHCGKGTYIRTLCRDIAQKAGSSAYVSYLMRLRSGMFDMKDAAALDKIEKMSAPEEIVMPMRQALQDMPAWYVHDEKKRMRLLNGLDQKMDISLPENTLCIAVTPDEKLLAIGHTTNGSFKPDKVFKDGE